MTSHEGTHYISNFTQAKLAFIKEFDIPLPGSMIRVGRPGQDTNVSKPEWRLAKNFAYISRRTASTRFANLMRKICPEDSVVWEPSENTEIVSIQGKLGFIHYRVLGQEL